MTTFDAAEERNEAAMLGAGYPESRDAWEDGLDPDRLAEIRGYSDEPTFEEGYGGVGDPKHSAHYDVYADVWDAREGK